jgi:hypothetical protein
MPVSDLTRLPWGPLNASTARNDPLSDNQNDAIENKQHPIDPDVPEIKHQGLRGLTRRERAAPREDDHHRNAEANLPVTLL